MILDSTAVVNLLATSKATSEIKAGELPFEQKIKELTTEVNDFRQLSHFSGQEKYCHFGYRVSFQH